MKNLSLLLFSALGFSAFSQDYEVKYYQNITAKKPEKLKTASASIQEKYIQNHNSFTLNYSDGISIYNNDFVTSPFSEEEKEKMNLAYEENKKK